MSSPGKKPPREVPCEWCQVRVPFDDAVWSIVPDLSSPTSEERLVSACTHDHIRLLHQRYDTGRDQGF